jgi:hypothetical protein
MAQIFLARLARPGNIDPLYEQFVSLQIIVYAAIPNDFLSEWPKFSRPDWQDLETVILSTSHLFLC